MDREHARFVATWHRSIRKFGPPPDYDTRVALSPLASSLAAFMWTAAKAMRRAPEYTLEEAAAALRSSPEEVLRAFNELHRRGVFVDDPRRAEPGAVEIHNR